MCGKSVKLLMKPVQRFSLTGYLLHCWIWKSIVPPSVTSWHCFRILTVFSRITLTVEPSPKIFGLLTTVGAWP